MRANTTGRNVTLSLFDDDPFFRSKVSPSPVEVAIAGLIWRHAGWKNPIRISEIYRLSGIPGLNARRIKKVVEQLRLIHHVPIGARREFPAGYYRIADEEDVERAIGAYRSQIFTMLRVMRACMPKSRCREFFGQLRLAWEE